MKQTGPNQLPQAMPMFFLNGVLEKVNSKQVWVLGRLYRLYRPLPQLHPDPEPYLALLGALAGALAVGPVNQLHFKTGAAATHSPTTQPRGAPQSHGRRSHRAPVSAKGRCRSSAQKATSRRARGATKLGRRGGGAARVK